MKIVFYNVKKREKVTIDSGNITKKKYEWETKAGSTQFCYALKAIDIDGTRLTKFCNEFDWNML